MYRGILERTSIRWIRKDGSGKGKGGGKGKVDMYPYKLRVVSMEFMLIMWAR